MPRPGEREERGSATLEAVAALAVAATLVLGIAAALPGSQFAGMAQNAICWLKTQTSCAAPAGAAAQAVPVQASSVGQAGSAPSAAPSADSGDRRSQEGQTRDDRRGRGKDKAPTGTGVNGPTAQGDGVGSPVPGTSVPEPTPPAWQPPDTGSGAYNSERAWPWDHGKKVLVELAANAMAGKWPDAARNLSHYLANTGQPLQQDVNRILHDVPQFQTQVDTTRTRLGEDAVSRAKASGATGPVTFPIDTPWNGYYIDPSQSANWFYALGGVSYNLTGQVTVYPPSTPGGPWRYEVSTRVNLRDQYNWDSGKSTQIGPITVSDDEMARLHRQGLAREYLNEGQSDISTTKGTVP